MPRMQHSQNAVLCVPCHEGGPSHGSGLHVLVGNILHYLTLDLGGLKPGAIAQNPPMEDIRIGSNGLPFNKVHLDTLITAIA